MVKQLFLLFILISCGVLRGQTLISSFPLELKKSSTYHQLFHMPNTATNELHVMAADRDNLHWIRYNSALFLTDSISVSKAGTDFKSFSGFGFDSYQNPTAYAVSDDFKKITCVNYDITTKKITIRDIATDFGKETVLQVFSANTAFYILTVSEESELQLYQLDRYVIHKKSYDTRTFKIALRNNKSQSLHDYFEQYPIERITVNELTPLFYSTNVAKLYVLPQLLLFTFDGLATQTQVLELDMEEEKVMVKNMPQLYPDLEGNSNSFYCNNFLFQIKATASTLFYGAVDYVTQELKLLRQYDKEDEVAEKNTSLYLQRGSQKPEIIKKTNKFLRQLQSSAVGITALPVQDGYFLTVGGQRSSMASGAIVAGILVGVSALAASNYDTGAYDWFDQETIRLSFFETDFDADFKFVSKDSRFFAVDYLNHFLSQNTSVTVMQSFKYKDYYLLGYYNKKEKSYLLRKFENEQ